LTTFNTVMLYEDGLTKTITITAPATGTCTFTGDYQYSNAIEQCSIRPFTPFNVNVVCADTSWSPNANTKCVGTSFTQTSNCGNTRTSSGTKQPQCAASSSITCGQNITSSNECSPCTEKGTLCQTDYYCSGSSCLPNPTCTTDNDCTQLNTNCKTGVCVLGQCDQTNKAQDTLCITGASLGKCTSGTCVITDIPPVECPACDCSMWMWISLVLGAILLIYMLK
jgi:hypothetical protein